MSILGAVQTPTGHEPVQPVLTDLALSYMILRSTFQPKQFRQPDTRRKNSVNRTLLVDMHNYNKTYNFILQHEKETAFTTAKHMFK